MTCPTMNDICGINGFFLETKSSRPEGASSSEGMQTVPKKRPEGATVLEGMLSVPIKRPEGATVLEGMRSVPFSTCNVLKPTYPLKQRIHPRNNHHARTE